MPFISLPRVFLWAFEGATIIVPQVTPEISGLDN